MSQLAALLPDPPPALRACARLRRAIPLIRCTTLRIGGPAAWIVEPICVEAALTWLNWLHAQAAPWCCLGLGSNLLAPDQGLHGFVLRFVHGLSGFQADLESSCVWAGAGMTNARFVESCRQIGLGGMEFLAVIPGTLGGAVATNAGAHGGETVEFLQAVRAWHPRHGLAEHVVQRKEFAYRQSPWKAAQGWIVLEACFRLQRMPPQQIAARRESVVRWRRAHHPQGYPNCGSVFRNPRGASAGQLIEAAGLKGHRLGGAQISPDHANFILNLERAHCRDVLRLAALARREVRLRTGLRLKLELELLRLQPQASRIQTPAQP